ncbi:MAG: glycoside hydrolase family 127 protein [bacterium]
MTSSRRDFLQRSAAATAAMALGPLGLAAAAESLPGASGSTDDPAGIKAFEDRMLRAKPVALNRVRVTGGPLKQAQDVTAKYLLALDPDRMMAFYRVRAGLAQKAEPYTGWDGGARNLTGHIAGHHLSAVSLMYEATGDVRFKERADYLVREMKEVQDKNGDGYLGALEGGREAFAAVSKGDIRSGGFDLNGLWSPWYTLHKTYAGLRDAYRHTGNRTALDVEVRYAKWAEGVLAPLSDAQVQKMLNTEHGGMNEVLADLYADTGDRKWLDLSYRFEHRAFTDALKRHQDNLSGKHGNCQIPKLIGSAARYGYTGDTSDILAASFFWDRVAQHHSYATGGHGLAEYFGAPDQLSARVDGRTCETCNVYNMLKLTRRLFSLRPDPLYADYHERVLFNQILASIDPEDGRTSYMVPVGRGVQQEYQDMQRDFTCCVGSGMESHALHGYGIYYESAETLWVNLFVPSTAQFTTGGASLEMKSGFPDGDSATMTLTLPSPKAFTLAVRRPVWAGDGFAITVNGQKIEQPLLATLRDPGAGGRGGAPGNEAVAPASTFVEIKRTWKSGDVVEVALPKEVRLEPTADNKQVAAIMWGPLVLAGDHGPRHEGRRAATTVDAPVPVLVVANRPVAEWVVPTGTRVGDFRAQQVARVPAQSGAPGDVALTPFYRTHRRNYSVYFDVLTPSDFDARGAAIAAERARLARMEAATLGNVQPGEMQPERDFNYQSEPADRPVARANGRANRAGTGWFSFDLAVDPTAKLAVVVTYLNELGLPPASGNFTIMVDGTQIAKFEPNAVATGFYLAQYGVPANLVQGKSKVTVRFQSGAPNGRIAPVFGVRMIRSDGV